MHHAPPPQPNHFLVYLRRIQSLERALAQAQDALHHDELTRLLNRRGLRRAHDQWQASRTAEAPTCCAMLDLDGFKGINDRFGHPVGDRALLHFAKMGLQHLRKTDVLARLGGDEFALILPRTNAQVATEVLAHLQRVVAATPLEIASSELRLEFSAGLAERRDDESWSEVLARADHMLLAIKAEKSKPTKQLQ